SLTSKKIQDYESSRKRMVHELDELLDDLMRNMGSEISSQRAVSSMVPPKELIRCGWTGWWGAREPWGAVWGLRGGRGRACAAPSPWPPRGQGQQSGVVPAQGVGAARALQCGTSGVPRATRG